MSKDALTSTGGHLRRAVARAVGSVALGAAGLALGVTLAAPSGAAERDLLGSALSGSVEATAQTVTRTTDTLGLTRPAADPADAADQVTGRPAAAEPPELEPLAPATRKATEPAPQRAPAAPSAEPAGKVDGPATGTVEGTLTPITDGLLKPVTEQVRTGVTEPVGEAVAQLTEKPVGHAAEIVEQVSDPVLKPVAEQVGEVVEPVTGSQGGLLTPATDLVRQVTSPLAPVSDGLLKPVVGAVSPVTDVVGDVTTPIVRALEPVTAPVTETVPPVVLPVGEVLTPVIEPLPPVPGVLVPEPSTQPAVPGGVSTVVPVEQVAGAEPTYPPALRAPGDVAVMVRASTGVQHATLDPMRMSVPRGATAADTTLALRVATAGVVRAGGAGPLGAGFPFAAGGAGNAVVAGAGGLLGGGAPQLKVLGGEVLAVLSALLLFRARSWRVATDESRGKLSSSYTDIPVSPA
ncbi:hypothetical protein APR04_004779 [Promicromonospora umidemergens]|nr:hypothetical protein [Promicromonospora umidemergens]MCP2285843.1 hypothetical protein [Promicromonospora umidemergens]